MTVRDDSSNVQAEDAVLTRSADLRKELSVRDLAFAQGLIVVTNLVGTALFVSTRRRAHVRRMR